MTSVLLYLVIDLNSFDVVDVVVVLDKFEMIRLLFVVYVTVNGKKEKCALSKVQRGMSLFFRREKKIIASTSAIHETTLRRQHGVGESTENP